LKFSSRLSFVVVATIFCTCVFVSAQSEASWNNQLADLATSRTYIQKRVSSYDRTGGNDDFVKIAPKEAIFLLDVPGPGNITHIWFTIASAETYHLKKLVFRIFWDDETMPSVEAPIGDFFGLGLGDYIQFESVPLSVAPDKALNCFFPMPFRKHARITVTNEGNENVDAFYFNIDYQALNKDLPPETLYFHAQYRQAAPAKGWTSDWKSNDTPAVTSKKNLDGEGNYIWMDAAGQGHFVGVTMSVVQNQDGWWGEGDDMFFIDGEKRPSINGTGSEDYFLGAWDFGDHPFSYGLYGAPVKGLELAGSRSSVYRFHLDSPIPFTKSLKATIEHGHANHRSDNFFSVAYWYQNEPHQPFPALPNVEDRIPRIHAVGGPGNAPK
jgi:hypothetical protein